jgi:phospholipid/cholesterol/gamma-HCH transport system ATP-binding protein
MISAMSKHGAGITHQVPVGSRDPSVPIELVDVVKELGSRPVLDRVSFAVPKGAITVLLGPSGAGKTVTIKHIMGLMTPSSGVVRVEGRDLAKVSEAELYELRQTMAVVLQGTLPFTCGLFFSLSVYDNVAFALRERNPRRPSEWIHQATIDCLEMVKLADRADSMPNQLSAGMCKRVAIARALALRASTIIIDDFDSGIDSVRLSLLCELIFRMHVDTGTTVLLSTHDLTAARMLADQLMVIHDGRIIACGDADEVFASEDPVVRQFLAADVSGPLGLSDTETVDNP